ncbi:RING-H2 finger protein ATL66-like [Gastrolobium bilobum]|uniref:RING-H2 finger protein ATL66-like n=1 Tax=Gastrolobium bilobum TaxID=150636 RepID=UPI002AB32386|nr:RING-H2 finger protein ATL66-like [Gastrolobium bilobum]
MSNQDAQVFNWHYDTELDDQNLGIRGRKLFFIIVLFSIILIFFALFLCARWICRYHGLLPTTFGSIQPHHAPPHLPPQGLDAETIKKLPIILHHTAASGPNRALEETECCICLSAFSDGEKLKVLPGCEHCFHCECVDKWLANHSSCPLCRASLKFDSSFPEILIQEPPIRINLQF